MILGGVEGELKSMFGLDENNNVRETFVPFGECWGLKEKS